MAAVRAVFCTNPKEVSADAGFCSEENLLHVARRRINGYIATGRAQHGKPNSGGKRWRRGTRVAGVVATGCVNKFPSLCLVRSSIMPGAFANSFSAGLEKVRGEWAM